MKTLFCKSDDRKNEKEKDEVIKDEDGKKVILEKVKRVRPWPDMPAEKKSIPEKDKKL